MTYVEIPSEEKYEICKKCENFISLTKQCKICMCFMPFKVKLKMNPCPEGKW